MINIYFQLLLATQHFPLLQLRFIIYFTKLTRGILPLLCTSKHRRRRMLQTALFSSSWRQQGCDVLRKMNWSILCVSVSTTGLGYSRVSHESVRFVQPPWMREVKRKRDSGEKSCHTHHQLATETWCAGSLERQYDSDLVIG